MDAMEVIREAATSALVDDDEQPIALVVAPGISAERIETLRAERGFELPGELLELLPQCGGLDCLPRFSRAWSLLETIDFTGQIGGFELDAVFPRCIPIAHDGCGNYWVLDASPGGADVAPVFFACHDAPVILYQAPSLAAFLAEVVKMYGPSHRSLVGDVHDDRIFDVWRKNPGTMTVAEAAIGDQVLKDFAAILDERFTVVDLRHAEVGMGFSWGRHGPQTELRRHGDARVFAYAPPVKRSHWSRLMGRGA